MKRFPPLFILTGLIIIFVFTSWELNAQAAHVLPPLYSISSHTFTNCGATGYNGPTLANCKSSYDTSWEDDTDFFNVQTQGFQEWTVHVTDGIDTVEADNAPFSITIDGANALSTYLEGLLPDEFALHQNYPNPFNPTTTLRYDLPDNGHVNIIIYDMLGREVRTLVNQTQDAGYRSVIWDATNDYGKPVSAGIYLYQIQAGEYISTKKMVLLK